MWTIHSKQFPIRTCSHLLSRLYFLFFLGFGAFYSSVATMHWQCIDGYLFLANPCSFCKLNSSVCNHQVPQTGLVPANTLAGTYGTGTYGTGTYGTGIYGTGTYGTYGAGLYGSSLPFLPSVFYRTRFQESEKTSQESCFFSNLRRKKISFHYLQLYCNFKIKRYLKSDPCLLFRTRLGATNATIGAESNQDKTLALDTAKVSKDDN